MEHSASISRPRRGFTIVELIAVLVLTAILGVVAAGSLRGLGASRAADAGRTVMRDLMYARERSMVSGRSHWVAFSAATHSYALRADDPGAPGYAGSAALIDPVTGAPMMVAFDREPHVGVQIVHVSFDDEAVIGFDWLGRPMLASGQRAGKEAQVQLTGGVIVTLDLSTGAPNLVIP